MFKFFTSASLPFIFLINASSQAITLFSKTDMKDGIKTQFCINGECKVFDGAIAVSLSEKLEGENYLIKVRYLNKIEKIFNWNQNSFERQSSEKIDSDKN